MEKYYNHKVQDDSDFEIGDSVWLLNTNYKTQRPSNKLDFKRLGPFKIIEKSKPNYTLELPPSLKIHPTFHVSLLEPYHSNTLPDRIQPSPPPEIIDGEEELEVKEVLDSKIVRKRLHYYVEWTGTEKPLAPLPRSIPSTATSHLPTTSTSSDSFNSNSSASKSPTPESLPHQYNTRGRPRASFSHFRYLIEDGEG